MRMTIALAATVAAFGAMLVAPTAAHAAPDASACSAPGTYSYLYGNTYRLIGAVDYYRYWQVVSRNGHYVGSYVVQCNGTAIAWSADLNSFGTRCDTTTDSQYRPDGDVARQLCERYDMKHILVDLDNVAHFSPEEAFAMVTAAPRRQDGMGARH